MAKTVKELAEEFGVSKQAINKSLTKGFREKYVSKVAGNGFQQLQINEAGYMELKRHYNKLHKDNKKSFKKVADNVADNVNSNQERLVASLNEQILTQKKELNTKNKQIEELHKMLNQSQQLQLMAEKKVAQIGHTREDYGEQTDEPMPLKNERGFWGRLFNVKKY